MDGIDSPGGLLEVSEGIYPYLGDIGAEYKNYYAKAKKEWRFESGARVKFTYLNIEKGAKRLQGLAYTYVGFDELTHYLEEDVWFLWARARSQSGVKPYMRATCNPDPDSWVKRLLLIGGYIDKEGWPVEGMSGVVRYFIRTSDGVMRWGDTREELIEAYPEYFDYSDLPEGVDRDAYDDITSFTFITATVYDNKELLNKNPEYLKGLKNLPPALQDAWLRGNWNTRFESGGFFKREAVDAAADHEPPKRFDRLVRVWDLAFTSEKKSRKRKADWSVGLLAGWVAETKTLYVLDVQRVRKSPAELERFVSEVADSDAVLFGSRYGKPVDVYLEEMPGAGKAVVQAYQTALDGYNVSGVPTRGKSKDERAMPVALALNAGNVRFAPGPWVGTLSNELIAFGGKSAVFDDQVDALAMAFGAVSSQPKISGLSFGVVSF